MTIFQKEITAFYEISKTEPTKSIQDDPYWTTMCVLFVLLDTMYNTVDEAKHARDIDSYMYKHNIPFETFYSEIQSGINCLLNENFEISNPDKELILLFYCLKRAICYKQYDNTIRTIKKKKAFYKSSIFSSLVFGIIIGAVLGIFGSYLLYTLFF